MRTQVIKNYWAKFKSRLSNYGMLGIITLIMFVFPLLPGSARVLLFHLGVSFVIILSVQATSEHFNISRIFQVLIALISIWASWFSNIEFIRAVARVFLFVFFMVRVQVFVKQLFTKKRVTTDVIVESINGYLLLGIAFGMLVALVSLGYPGSFNIDFADTMSDYYNPYYYSFVTMTTLGYGDIVPLEVAAKSISVLICLAGQLYLVTVMSVLIGRLLGAQEITNE